MLLRRAPAPPDGMRARRRGVMVGSDVQSVKSSTEGSRTAFAWGTCAAPRTARNERRTQTCRHTVRQVQAVSAAEETQVQKSAKCSSSVPARAARTLPFLRGATLPRAKITWLFVALTLWWAKKQTQKSQEKAGHGDTTNAMPSGKESGSRLSLPVPAGPLAVVVLERYHLVRRPSHCLACVTPALPNH